MNLSFNQFILLNYYYYSPLIINSKVKINNSLFKFFFNSFLYQNSFNSYFLQIKFSNFLNSCIQLSSIEYNSPQSFSNLNVSFMNCDFNLCNSIQGGAIYMTGLNNNIFIINCKFNKCYASNQGGSIFIELAKEVIITRSIFSFSSALHSSSFRIGFNTQSVKNENMNYTIEIFPSAGGHGSFHNSFNLTYSYNNYSHSLSNTIYDADFFLTTTNSNGIKFSYINNVRCKNFLGFYINCKSPQFYCDNFINDTCSKFVNMYSTLITNIIFERCYLSDLIFQYTSDSKVLIFNNSFFSMNSFDTSQCLLFQNNLFQINFPTNNIYQCKFIQTKINSYSNFFFNYFINLIIL